MVPGSSSSVFRNVVPGTAGQASSGTLFQQAASSGTRCLRLVVALGLAVVLSPGWAMATTPAPAAAPAPAATPDATPQSVHRLIQQLGDNDYFVRQRAESELAKLGFDAFDALTEATSNDDLEIVARTKYLLRLLRVEWATAADPPEVKMLLRDYKAQNFEMRQTRLRSLAGLPGEVGVAALCRLAQLREVAPVVQAGGPGTAGRPEAR